MVEAGGRKVAFAIAFAVEALDIAEDSPDMDHWEPMEDQHLVAYSYKINNH